MFHIGPIAGQTSHRNTEDRTRTRPARLAMPSLGTMRTEWPVKRKSIYLHEAFQQITCHEARERIKKWGMWSSVDLPAVHHRSWCESLMHPNWPLTKMSEGFNFMQQLARRWVEINSYNLNLEFGVLSAEVWCLFLSWTDFLSAISMMKKKIMLTNEVSVQPWLSQGKLAAAETLFSLYIKWH